MRSVRWKHAAPKAKARPRHEPGKMNKTEEAYFEQVLKPRVMAGELASAQFEVLKLRLAKATFYDTDFLVVTADGQIEIHEVKGHWEDDARVKFKVAVEMFPWFKFRVVQRIKGQWIFDDY